MRDDTPSQLFVSYSHPDQSDMLIFRKHLKGMLLDKVQVWSDQDISTGTDWNLLLEGNLNLASSALVLATPDYLISSWCRYELQKLSAAKRAGRLRNLFWVQLRPCGWQHTELAEFQAFAAELAINESPDETRRQRAILQVCEQIATEMVRSITQKDIELSMVRRLLMNKPEYTVNEILARGEFSTVCVGSNGSINVAIKVLKWVPLESFTDALQRIGDERKKLVHPSFVRLYDIFQVGGEGERRTVFVSEYMGKNSAVLGSEFSADREQRKPFPVGTVVLHLRRMAEGLSKLHRTEFKQEWERTLGLLTADHVFYDQTAERLRVSPIGASAFLWHVLDCEKYAEWIDPNSKVYIAPEQRESPVGHVTPKTDQYMLGLIGVELLEGLRFRQILNGKPVEQFWNNPGGFLDGPWKSNRKQLWRILERMLAKEPSGRFANMDEIEQSLYVLEEEGRALAKSVYLSPDTQALGQLQLAAFFEQFYKNFFEASPESKKKFKSVEEQHQKLMMAMSAVLNFRPGNRPTSLDQILEKHRHKEITRDEFENFHKSFFATLNNFIPDTKMSRARRIKRDIQRGYRLHDFRMRRVAGREARERPRWG
jgi:serine/threonine protein kinase